MKLNPFYICMTPSKGFPKLQTYFSFVFRLKMSYEKEELKSGETIIDSCVILSYIIPLLDFCGKKKCFFQRVDFILE